MNKIDPNSPVPMYFQLKEILLRSIEEDGLRKNDKLLSVRALIRKYSVSLPVVTRALRELEKDNVITIRKAKGSFVKIPPAGRLVSSRKILFLLYGRDFSDPYYSKILTGIEREAAAKRFSVLYKSVDNQNKGVSGAFKGDGLTGIVIAGDVDVKKLDEVRKMKVPFVLTGDLPLPEKITTVANDDRFGAYTAVKYLLELGHRRIGLITGPRELSVWRNRWLGYKDAMEEYGLPVKKNNIVETGDEQNISSGYNAMEKLMLCSEPPTAVFTGNDRYALGVYLFLGEKGMRAGEDVSIVGFDDLEFAETLIPSLTTVRVNMEEVGIRSVQILLEQIKTPKLIFRQEIVPIRLIERKSCRKYSPKFCV